MSDSISLPSGYPQAITGRRNLLISAWAVVLLLTVPQIILRGFMQLDTSWMLPAQIGLLVVLLALVFLVIYGGEAWFFLTVVPQSQLYASVFDSNPNLAFFGERLLRIGASLVMLLILLAMGFKRQDFFLKVGDLKADAKPEKWGVPRRRETWPGFSLRYAVIIVVIFLIFMVPTLQPSLTNLSVQLLLFAALCALLNAFAEEFLYRSALLPQVLPLFGKDASMILVAGWFGIGHYFGVPTGITGVILTTIGGWVFAKAMVETRGIGWSMFMHFVSDFTIFTIILLAGGF